MKLIAKSIDISLCSAKSARWDVLKRKVVLQNIIVSNWKHINRHCSKKTNNIAHFAGVLPSALPLNVACGIRVHSHGASAFASVTKRPRLISMWLLRGKDKAIADPNTDAQCDWPLIAHLLKNDPRKCSGYNISGILFSLFKLNFKIFSDPKPQNTGPNPQELEDLWDTVSGELSAIFQGRAEIPENVAPFDAASEVDVDQQR